MKRILNSFLIFILLITSCIPFYSENKVFAAEQPNCEQESEEDWRMLWQADPRWGNNIATTERSFTVGDAGCLMCSVMMLMAYDKPELRDWNVFNPYIATMPEPKMSTTYEWPGFPEYNLPGTDFKCVDRDRYISGSNEEKANTIKKVIEEEELYVVIWTGSHYVACTGWNEELSQPILQDSGGPGYDARKVDAKSNWERYASSIIKLQVYKGDRKPTDTLIGYSTDFSISKTKRKITKDTYEYQGQFYTEKELPGLEEIEAYIIQNQIIIDPLNKDELSYREQQNLAKLKADIDQSKNTLPKIANIAVSTVSLILAVYCLLLLLALAFDKANTIIDFSLVETLTLHKIRIGDSDENYIGYVDNTRTVSQRQFLTSILFILMVSIGLMSGLIQKVIYILSDLIAPFIT